jgi:Cu(I)/Ag(I) efflux system membrane fusion protein
VPVYRAYLKSQMALATDDLQGAKGAFGRLVQAITDVDMSLFQDKAHTRWMEISRALSNAAQKGYSAETLTAARDAFYHVSLSAIELHDTFGHAGDSSYYLTYCPMARNNAGAYWLQTVDTVWNSFYGEAMQRCGEIKQELHAGTEVTE